MDAPLAPPPPLRDLAGDAHSGRRRGVVEVEGGGGDSPLTPADRGLAGSAVGGRGGRGGDDPPGASGSGGMVSDAPRARASPGMRRGEAVG